MREYQVGPTSPLGMHSLVKLTQILMTYQHVRRFLVSKAEQRVEFVPSPQLLNHTKYPSKVYDLDSVRTRSRRSIRRAQ